MKKKLYENPEAELLTVRFEENFMQGSPVAGGAGGDDTIVDDPDMD